MDMLFLHLKRQLSFLRTFGLMILFPIVMIYIALNLQRVVPIQLLLRDANAEAYDPELGVLFFQGAFSNVGILLWWSAAIVSAFAYFLLRFVLRAKATTRLSRTFLLYMAVFTVVLVLDDLFMLHEEVFPVRLGISEIAVYGVYGVLTMALVCFVRFLVQTDFLLLLLAFGFFGFSLLTDQGMLRFLFAMPPTPDLWAEDMTKMLGIVCWLVFLLRTATQQLRLTTPKQSRPKPRRNAAYTRPVTEPTTVPATAQPRPPHNVAPRNVRIKGSAADNRAAQGLANPKSVKTGQVHRHHAER